MQWVRCRGLRLCTSGRDGLWEGEKTVTRPRIRRAGGGALACTIVGGRLKRGRRVGFPELVNDEEVSWRM